MTPQPPASWWCYSMTYAEFSALAAKEWPRMNASKAASMVDALARESFRLHNAGGNTRKGRYGLSLPDYGG